MDENRVVERYIASDRKKPKVGIVSLRTHVSPKAQSILYIRELLTNQMMPK